MPQCDVNKAALQLNCNQTSAWVFSCKLAPYFQNTFSKEHLWRAVFVQQSSNLCGSHAGSLWEFEMFRISRNGGKEDR